MDKDIINILQTPLLDKINYPKDLKKIPKNQLENIKNSKYIFLSHGHPDHIDPESFDIFKNKTLIIADHYGDRIYNDLKENYNCIKLKSNTWLDISKNVRVKTFADWNQDSAIIIEILKKNIIFNLNLLKQFLYNQLHVFHFYY